MAQKTCQWLRKPAEGPENLPRARKINLTEMPCVGLIRGDRRLGWEACETIARVPSPAVAQDF